MVKLLLALVLMAGATVSPGRQTSAGLRARYQVVTEYEVRPGILMAAKYAADGQACEMILAKRPIPGPAAALGSSIPHNQAQQLIDELAPDKGKPAKPYPRGNSASTISNNVEFTKTDFENVSVETLASVTSCPQDNVVIIIRWKKRACAASQPLPS